MNNWASWGASVTGPAHVMSGAENQDACGAWHFSWGDVLVVSDGLGSCPNSAKGARLACESVRHAAEFCAETGSWRFHDLAHFIQVIWRMLVSPDSPRNCSATCLFVIRVHGGDVIMGALGDGLLAGVKTDGSLKVLSFNKEDSFANVTTSLSATPGKCWLIHRGADIDFRGFLLCTDGVADDLLPEAVDGFVPETLSHYSTINCEDASAQVTAWLEAWPVPGHTDDKTIACLYQLNDSNA